MSADVNNERSLKGMRMFKIFLSIFIYAITLCNAFPQIAVSMEEQLIQTTSFISGKNTTSKITSSGTGFFYADSTLLPGAILLITNKHVIKGCDKGIITFNKIDNKGRIYGNREIVEIANFESHWILHRDPKVDLCYMNVSPIIELYKNKGIQLFTRTLSRSLIPADSIWSTMTVLEEVIMIGYPAGIMDQSNNIPIIRTGVTATPPKLNYNSQQEFLIDIAAFPGSSGSPIILRRIPYGLKDSPNGISIGFFPEFYLVGILYARPTYSPEIKELNFVPINELSEIMRLKTDLMINLGNVIKSTEITKMIESKK